jgi:hypothetical protein
MESSESMNEDERDRLVTDEAIEAALRGLPAVNVPRDLEAKLIAGIPRARVSLQRTPKRPRHWQWLVLSASVAAILLVTIGIAGWRANRKAVSESGRTSPSANSAMVAVTVVQTKETDPCNILPPLHNWR